MLTSNRLKEFSNKIYNLYEKYYLNIFEEYLILYRHKSSKFSITVKIDKVINWMDELLKIKKQYKLKIGTSTKFIKLT